MNISYYQKGNQCILPMVTKTINHVQTATIEASLNLAFFCQTGSIRSIWQKQWCMKLVIVCGTTSIENSVTNWFSIRLVILGPGFNSNKVLVNGQYLWLNKRKLKWYSWPITFCASNKYLKYIVKRITKFWLGQCKKGKFPFRPNFNGP